MARYRPVRSLGRSGGDADVLGDPERDPFRPTGLGLAVRPAAAQVGGQLAFELDLGLDEQRLVVSRATPASSGCSGTAPAASLRSAQVTSLPAAAPTTWPATAGGQGAWALVAGHALRVPLSPFRAVADPVSTTATTRGPRQR